MGIKLGRGGNGGGSLSVRNDQIFANATARDTYFTNNPSELVEDLNISTAGVLQKRISGAWVDASAIIRGQQGEPAPALIINYSTDGLTGWTSTLNSLTHKYWRWSTDNGVTWTPEQPNVAKFNAVNSSTGIPAPFEYQLSGDGKLQLLKGSTIIQEADEYGSWIINSVSTGTGSVHLGELHSIGSANENVIFKNEDSTLAWHPCWGAISADGSQVIEQSARVHANTIQMVQLAGSLGASTVDYDSSFTCSADVVFLYVDLFPKETYSGKLILTVTKTSNDKEISRFEFDANYINGVKARVPFKYPLWMFTGQQFKATIKKPNGTFLRVASNFDGTQPYRESYYRTFTDKKVLHEGNITLTARTLETLTGADRLSGAAIKDYPVASPTISGTIKLGTTLSIDGNGVAEVAVSPTGIKIVANQAGRLAIPQSTGALLAIQQDSGFTYGIEANQDTSVNANWKQIGVVATNVVSFKGRTGAVVPTTGDYNQKQVKTIHDDTLVEGFFGIDNTGIYWDDGV